ncbi:MAG: arsenic metallochaperone ArsD family protein [Firmicutes bacterium]|nr:arsenic metallochaperone ArsD family protein [Bacillota bacterium]
MLTPGSLGSETAVWNLSSTNQSLKVYIKLGGELLLVINEMLKTEGIEVLPITMVDGTVVKTKTYPRDDEFCNLLNVPENYLKASINSAKVTLKVKSKGCGCEDGCC